MPIEHCRPLRDRIKDGFVLDDIAALLTGREWSAADDLDRVAELVRSTGRVIAPPDEGEST